MKILRARKHLEVFYAILRGEVAYPIVGEPYGAIEEDGRAYPLSELTLLAPCQPSKVVAVGINYAKHAAEVATEQPKDPLLFLKPSTTIIGPEEAIVYPRAMSRQVDYEAELAVVIKRCCKDVPLGGYADVVLGYTCLNDVTARDLQRKDGQWTRSKGFDTFTPIGPFIETELDTSNVRVESRLNGEVRQSSTTADMMHNVDKLIHHISSIMTLLPGDVIATGTPEGIGPMQIGDVVEIEVDGIGVLRNTVI